MAAGDPTRAARYREHALRGGAPSARRFGEPDFVDQHGNGYRVPFGAADEALALTPTGGRTRGAGAAPESEESEPGARRTAVEAFLRRDTTGPADRVAPLWFRQRRRTGKWRREQRAGGTRTQALRGEPRRNEELVLTPRSDAARLAWAGVGGDGDTALRVQLHSHTGPSNALGGPGTGTAYVRL